MGGCSSSTGYTLANNEISKCQTLYPSSIAETNNRWIEMIVKRMEKMGIKVHASEVVIYLCLAPQYRTDPKPKCYSSIKAASATEEQLKRNARNAFITAGSVSFCKQKGWSKTSNDFGVTVPIRKIKNITFNLQYKVIAIIFETVTAPDEDQLVMYQTHMLDRLLSSLAKVLVMAYSGQPEWSIPITWKIPGISLPSIDSNVYQQSMGIDHGFTSSLYAAILGNHMQAYFGRATFPHTIFSEIIQAQQAEQFINRPQLLDLSILRNRIAPNQEKVIFMTEALNCLPFNLAYRTVKVTDTDPTVRNGKYKEAFTNALTNVMHYNVTLRELDLSGTNLQGLGIEMGQALAMNIQPLISRINFASCSLSTEDVLGLIPGLTRSWCGGSSTPESINFSNNKAVSTNTWDRLFETLIDPTIFPFWPSGNPPPAAPLHYLQSVNMIGTNAASTKFAQFVSLLSGLRSISLESEGTADVGMHATIMTLTSLDAPLTSFNGIKMSSKDITPMLFRHHGTIKNVSLSHLHGNLTPLLMQWPIAVPNVKLMLDGATFAHARNDSSSFRSLFSECHCPGSILIKPKNQDGESHPLNVRDRHSIETQSLCQDIIPIISSANGLKALYLHDVYYASLNGAALASSSIKTLHVILSSPAENLHIAFQLEQAQDFWTSLAASKTLEELYLPNQFSNKSGECTMVGQFLRTNRSVRRIGFDGNYVLSAEDAKALRSAFYGNKKVISMSSFDSAMKRTIKEAEAETFQCTQRVAENKYQIKLLFKRHYSKYNYRWRDTPNRLKVPIVQNIATDKRRIGAIKRDNVKTSSALILMNSCITKNKQAYDQVQKEKRNTKMERKSAQFNNIAMKKQRIATKLVTKLHKAKSRGRRMKSGKTQVPRSAYYRSKQRWMKPNFRPPNSQFHHHSHYNSINDPYGSRFGYYHMYPGWNNHYFNDNYYHDSGDQENVEDGNVEEVEDGNVEEVEVNEEGEIDLGELNNDDQGATEPLEVGGNEDVWGTLLSEGDNFETSTTDDPWAGMDTAMENVGTDPLQVLTPEVLSQIHTEAAELGPDVSADISTLIDENSQVDAKIESIADGIGVDTNVVQDEVQEQFDQLDFDMNEVQDNLGAIPEYEEDEDFDDEEEDAVDMYAGGGPRDLDDGGSDFRKTDAAFAGACRRAKTRKINRVLRRVRSVVPGNGYQHFSFTEKPREVFNSSKSSLVWSNDLATEWKEEIINAQVSAMSKSNLFSFPEVSNSSPKRILGWSGSTIDSSKSKDMPISVTLCRLQLREFGLTSTSHLNKPEHSDPSSVRTSPVCAVLDAYLDNIMANVPELALCLQERGHIQSMKMLRTDDIPILTSHDLDPTGISPVSDKVRDPKTKSLFSPQIVESNASILLQFLKTNCSKENSTYLLRRNAGDTNIQLYDITSLSTKRHCKWNWWLAMMSYRFALRLDQLSNTVISKEDRGTRRKFRSRQRHLFQISYELLEELSDMDGGDHETIRAAVCENLANTFLRDDGEDGDDGSNDSPTEKQSQQSPDRNNSIPSISSTKYPSTQPYGNVNVDRLSKAQDHLLRGIQLLKPALESGLSDDSKNDNSSVDPIALQQFGLHHKLTNILLRLAERYFHNYWSSSAMQTLRTTGRTISDASKLLLQLGIVDDDWKFLDDFEQRQGHMSNRSGRDFACSISYQYAWLWEHCGHFARSFAADELWRERGHTCGEDVVCVIKDVEAAASNVSKVISCLISTKRKDVDSLENLEKFHFSSIMMKTKGLLNLNNVSGIISERCDIVSESAINEANSILNKQKQIVRDKRKVLVAAAICYSSAVGIFTHVITGVEVEIVKDGDVPNSVRVHKSQPQSLDSSILSLLRQRLGDSCNEIGKVLLTEVKKLLKVGGDLSSLSPLLLSSESWFIDGLNEFEDCSDAQNIALIRCNLCHCCKIRVNLTLPRRPLSSVVNNGTVQDSHAELCLQDAARHLELAHEALDQRDKVNPRTWDMVSDELAATFLILGVRRRQSYLPGSTPVVIQSLRLNPGKERSIVEPMVRAKEIYASLNNNHQAAAADYHLALFYSKVWTCQRDAEKTREKLSAAFTHFSLAHKYFFTHMLSNEPTFVILCLDLSNLYSAVSGETECLQKALACCLDTCDAFSPRSYKRSKESQSSDEWFGKMKTLASSVEERILKLLQNLVKVEKDASEKKSTTSKTLYRLALTFKMASAHDKHEDAEFFPIYNLLTQIREEHKQCYAKMNT